MNFYDITVLPNIKSAPTYFARTRDFMVQLWQTFITMITISTIDSCFETQNLLLTFKDRIQNRTRIFHINTYTAVMIYPQ